MRKIYKYVGTNRLAIILPSFEFSNFSYVRPINDRNHLLKLWKQNEIKRIQYNSHNIIDYERFENWNNIYPKDEEFYKVYIYKHLYEPYFITHRLSPL